MRTDTETVVMSTWESDYFARLIASQLGLFTVKAERREFRGGEQYYRIDVQDRFDLAGKNVVYVASTHSDATLLELIRVCDTLVSDALINKLVVVIPFMGYSTMERAKHPIEVVTAKTNARMLSKMLPSAFFFYLDLHKEGLTKYHEDGGRSMELYAEPVLIPAIQKLKLPMDNLVVASADLGRPKWVKSYAKKFKSHIALVDKDRDFEEIYTGQVIGGVKNMHVLIYDDMYRSGTTAIQAADAYLQAGALTVDLVCSHLAITDDRALQDLETSPIRKIITTNSHPMSQHFMVDSSQKTTVADVSGEFVVPIRKILRLQ